jgi:hypothetical protein
MSIRRYDEGYEYEHARHESAAADVTAAAMAFVVLFFMFIGKNVMLHKFYGILFC